MCARAHACVCVWGGGVGGWVCMCITCMLESVCACVKLA